MSTDNIFDTPPKDPVVDETTSLVDQLVGEGKKFKTPEDLAKGKVEADRFIESLKRENEGMRQDLNARLKMEDLIEKLKNSKPTDTNQQPTGSNEQPLGDQLQISPKDIEQLLDDKLKERETQRQMESNRNLVIGELSKVYGPDYGKVVQDKANELGVSVSFFQDMVDKQPRAFLKLMDTTKKPSTPPVNPNPFRTSVNTSAIDSKNSGQKDWNYYEKMRKENPGNYWKPETQLELHKAAIAQGDNFNSN